MLKTKSETMKLLGRAYRNTVDIQQFVRTPDGMGGYSSDWVTMATVGAYFKTPRVATVSETGTVASEMTHEIKIHNRTGSPAVSKGWRVLYGAKTFSVEHAYDDEYDMTKVLVCREVVK